MSETNLIPLPPVEGEAVSCEIFPTKMQAVIFRNWDIVPEERIARCLATDVGNIRKQAEKMGLEPQKDVSVWLERGYISIIKANWHLLPYSQLMQLLDMDENRLAFILKEEDFLDIKLGSKKPECDEVIYAELTEEQESRTQIMRNIIKKSTVAVEGEKPPFEFFTESRNVNSVKKQKKSSENKTVTDGEWAIVDTTNDVNVCTMIKRFEKKVKERFDICFAEKSDKNIIFRFFEDEKEPEYHEIEIRENEIEITGADSAAIQRAITFIEDMAQENGAMCFERKIYKRKAKFKTRFIYSFCGLYNDAFDVDSRIFCPDELLEKYAETGVNGIWMQAILYRMSEFPFEPSLSEGWQNRLKRLKEFSDRAMTYGIKLYLYINEPRAMSMEFFKKYPDLLGNKRDGYGCLCTSAKEVQQYLSDGIKAICKAVPELGGFFTITCSENITNCYSLKTEMTCPRCANRKAYEVIAEVNTIIADSVAEINPNIKVIAWDWVWQANKFMTADEVEKCIKLMPKNVILMANRDIDLPTNVGGIKGNVNDYSISVCGISDLAREEWKCAKAEGHETAARLQINNSWELSTIPYLPVFELLTESIEALSQEGIQHLSLSWTLGGYPSPNIKIVSELFFENSDKTVKTDIFRSLYGEFAEKVKEATDIFSDAFKEFPFDIIGLYFGPQHGGVSNLLYLEKTGMKSTMTCFAYDDLKNWRGIYPEDIYENQFKVLCEKWALGMKRLEDMPECELKDMAEATYIQFKSSYNQIKFIRARGNGFEKSIMLDVLKEEKELAKQMLVLMKKNPTIGFEATNHYYYTQGMILEKIWNCEYLSMELGTENTAE